jgi:hypothetical protein
VLGGNPMRPALRLFRGDEETSVRPEPRKTISFGQLTRLLTEAVGAHRTWLDDFASDQVQVPVDLYEVLTAYQRIRPGA